MIFEINYSQKLLSTGKIYRKYGDRMEISERTLFILVDIVSRQPLSNMDTNHPFENYQTDIICHDLWLGNSFYFVWRFPLNIIPRYQFWWPNVLHKHKHNSGLNPHVYKYIRIIWCSELPKKHLFIIIIAAASRLNMNMKLPFIRMFHSGFCFESEHRVFMPNYSSIFLYQIIHIFRNQLTFCWCIDINLCEINKILKYIQKPHLLRW